MERTNERRENTEELSAESIESDESDRLRTKVWNSGKSGGNPKPNEKLGTFTVNIRGVL